MACQLIFSTDVSPNDRRDVRACFHLDKDFEYKCEFTPAYAKWKMVQMLEWIMERAEGIVYVSKMYGYSDTFAIYHNSDALDFAITMELAEIENSYGDKFARQMKKEITKDRWGDFNIIDWVKV